MLVAEVSLQIRKLIHKHFQRDTFSETCIRVEV